MERIMKVRKNQYGYYERVDMPSLNSIQDMFQNKFFQGQIHTSYSNKYSEQEIRSFTRNAKKKEWVLQRFFSEDIKRNFLDVGCGEGYVLNYFYQKGWNVTGIDLSDYGLSVHNPQLQEFVRKGDCNVILEEMVQQNKKFDVVNSDLFIECCTDLIRTLKNMKQVIHKETGIVLIRVGNYLSPLHKKLLEQGTLQEDTWFNRNANYSYFGKESLNNLLEKLGFQCLEWYGDTFMDFNLMNPLTDYYKVEGAGKICYKAMLDSEDIIEDSSLENMIKLEKIMGEMGMGRHIMCVCKIGRE